MLPALHTSRSHPTSRRRHDRREAAHDIDLGAYHDSSDPERIAVNIETIYRELDPTRPVVLIVELMERWLAGSATDEQARDRPTIAAVPSARCLPATAADVEIAGDAIRLPRMACIACC